MGLRANLSREPLVSVIIIFLNAEKFIQEAIESVLLQSYENWELILVNDGSMDASSQTAQGYVEQYPDRVRYLEHQNHQNRGMSTSRNLGMKHARGDYLSYLDADDIWMPEKLARHVAILEQHPEAALVFGPWESWSSWNKCLESPDCIQNLQVPTNTLVPSQNLVPVWLQKEISIPGHCATLLRRENVEKVGGFEDSFRSHYEDLVLLTKIHLQAPVFVDSVCLSRYRQHPESCCYGQGRVWVAWGVYLHWLKQYLQEHRITNQQIWKALREQLLAVQYPTLYQLMKYSQHPIKSLKKLMKWTAGWMLPASAYSWLKVHWRMYRRWQTG